jgi:hypothetical protein
MSQQLMKVNGAFSGVEVMVTLQPPPGGEEVALRLYENGLDITLWYLVPAPPPADLPVPPPRTFLLTALPDMPTNFVKYIGSLLANGADAHVVEVSV